MGISNGTPAPVGQPLHPAFLVAIEYLVTRFAGVPELPAQVEPQIEVFHPSPNTPSTAFSVPPQKREKV
jgi:hypothetical protein